MMKDPNPPLPKGRPKSELENRVEKLELLVEALQTVIAGLKNTLAKQGIK